MAKRVNAYTSTSIGKEKLIILTDFQAYLKEKFGLTVTHQNINDLALDRAWREKEAFGRELADQDPEMAEFLRLKAKLEAKGKI